MREGKQFPVVFLFFQLARELQRTKQMRSMKGITVVQLFLFFLTILFACGVHYKIPFNLAGYNCPMYNLLNRECTHTNFYPHSKYKCYAFGPFLCRYISESHDILQTSHNDKFSSDLQKSLPIGVRLGQFAAMVWTNQLQLLAQNIFIFCLFFLV